MTDPLSKLINNLRNLEGTHTVPLDELLDADFMRQNTKFASLDELVAAGGFESFEAVAAASEPWDEHVRNSTCFDSWDEMLTVATSRWADRFLS